MLPLSTVQTYLFKLAAPDMPKTFIMVESGVRMHTTTFMREKGDTPNNFCVKVPGYGSPRLSLTGAAAPEAHSN